MATENQSGDRPRGREQVRDAVLTATRELLVERGLDGFSVRDVAAAAGVNHALVHRYFGTKADVLEAVLAAEAAQLVEAVSAARQRPSGTTTTPNSAQSGQSERSAAVLAALEGQPIFWRALAHAVLEAPESAIPGTALTTEFFGSLWRGAAGERAAEASLAGATVLGWLLFGTFMTDSTGADPDAVRALVAEQVASLTG